jgi:hypothetical protein
MACCSIAMLLCRAKALVRTIKRDYVRFSPRPNAESVTRHLPSWIAQPGVSWVSTRVVHPDGEVAVAPEGRMCALVRTRHF